MLAITNWFIKLVYMKIETIGAFEAKTHFSQLLEKAQQGTTFIVTRRGKPVAQLGPSEEPPSHPVFGSAKGQVKISDDFDTPIDDMADYMT